MARARHRRIRIQRGEPLPAEHRERGGPRDPRPPRVEESPPPRGPPIRARLPVAEAVSRDRGEGPPLRTRRKDPDGGARPRVLESGDGRGLQVTAVPSPDGPLTREAQIRSLG